MTDTEYKIFQNKLLLLAELVKDLKIDEFLDRINAAEAIAPIINPTLYIQGEPNLSKIKKLTQGLLYFQNEINDIDK